jgi:peroxiredoxin Q/BCP
MKLITIILGLVLVACGGETETPDTTPPPGDSVVLDTGGQDVALDGSGDVSKDIADAADILEDALADADVPAQVDTSAPGDDVIPDVAPDTLPDPDLASDGNTLPEGLIGEAPTGDVTLPDFVAVVDQDGNKVLQSQLKGLWSVVWFYPAASTGGWSDEGCGFRDRYEQFEALGVQIVGVSFDSPEKNKKFKEEDKFQFDLYSDVEKELASHYGAYNQILPMFAMRVTVILNPEGEWVLAYPSVKGSLYKHAQQVLDDLKLLLPWPQGTFEARALRSDEFDLQESGIVSFSPRWPPGCCRRTGSGDTFEILYQGTGLI